jgi:hypothetical protein
MIVHVTQNEQHIFECVAAEATGAPVVGRGVSVLEAVGEWAIQTGEVLVMCKPAAVLQCYRVDGKYQDLEFKGSYNRD